MTATVATAMPVPAIMEEFAKMVAGEKVVNYIGNCYDDLAVKFIKMQEFIAALRNLVFTVGTRCFLEEEWVGKQKKKRKRC